MGVLNKQPSVSVIIDYVHLYIEAWSKVHTA